jgi:glycosyltransferase involved in cell wall biosynthesis
MRVLILNGDLPVFPGQIGNEYLHTTRLARLVERVGLVSLLHTREQDEKKRGLVEAGVILYLWRSPRIDTPTRESSLDKPRLMRRLAEATYNATRNWRGLPADTLIQDLQFRNIAGPLVEALSEGPWEALVVVQSNCARWLDYLPRPPASVLVMHDVRALVYERRAAAAGSLIERWACRREARRYRRFERTYCRRFDLVVTVSPADEAWVRAHYRPRRLITVPLPVDRSYFAPMPGIRVRPERIVFTGMMAHPPNVDAAGFFAREVLPRVQMKRPEAEFWIVGRDATSSVASLAMLPGVVVTGFVPDIRPYIAQASVVVVPLRFGSGMRNKILEAWAMEKCVVSTRVGAEGLDCEDGANIVLADDAQTLADRVVDAMSNPALRDRVRTRGRALVASSHDPDALANRYADAIGAALRETARAEAPLRALIDLRWMRPGVAGGIENLSRSFLDHLIRLDRFNHYTVLVAAEVQYDFDTRGGPNVKVVAGDGLRVAMREAGLRALRLLHRRLRLQYWRTPEVETLRRAGAMDAEVALSIPGYIHADLMPLTNVLVVPDIQHEYCPEFFSGRELDERRRLYTQSARRAVHLCAISEFTRQTLIERLGTAPERVTTTRLAADPIFEPESPARGDHRRVLDRYSLPSGQYLLFPANTWPHKNHQGAVEALRLLREAYGLDPLLVCTGSSKGAEGELHAKIRAAGLEARVRFLGYCPTSDMPALYEGAAALVFPSLFEGFGIPLLEAMWCDCPIVCSNTTSLPEIAGDAALLVDPRSPEDLAHAMSRVLTDTATRQTLIERGRRQVKGFSWQEFTLAIVSVLYRARLLRAG